MILSEPFRSFGVGVCILCMPSLILAAPEVIRASDVRKAIDKTGASLVRVQSDLQIVSKGYAISERIPTKRLQRRLREAEIQALLGDHYRASIILYDVADRPELSTHPEYDKAMFQLAESLRLAGYPQAARMQYEVLAKKKSGSELTRAVLGLLEVASQTGDFSGVETYVNRVKKGTSTEDAKIDYIFGKALFRGADDDQSRLKRALGKFRSVPRGLSISAPAAYYAGVTLVRMEEYEPAIQEFERTLELSSSYNDHLLMSELAYLSLGRLYRELGNVSGALDAYRSIAKDSPHFTDMLFEVAWVYVAAANSVEQDSEEQLRNYRLALDATELLMAAARDSRLYPQARVLQGNLQIRLGAPETAYETFQTVIDGYSSAQAELDNLLRSQSDSRAFFNELVNADLKTLDVGNGLLPDLALQFALEDPKVADTVEVRRELAHVEAELEESVEIIQNLESALNSSQRYGMFPEIRDARLVALSIVNRLTKMTQKLLEVSRGLAFEHLDTRDLARLEAGRLRHEKTEVEASKLPQTVEEIQEWHTLVRSKLEEVEHRAFMQISGLEMLRGQLIGVQLWMSRHRPDMPVQERLKIKERIRNTEVHLDDVIRSIDDVRKQVRQTNLQVYGDGGWEKSNQLMVELRDWANKQRQILQTVYSQLPAEKLEVLNAVDQQMNNVAALEQELNQLEAGLEQAVADRIDEIRTKVLKEFRFLETHRNEHIRLLSMSDRQLGPVAEQTVAWVGEQFKELVLKADVGILDVAWARKRARTDEVTGLVRELRQKANELDSEFEDALEVR